MAKSSVTRRDLYWFEVTGDAYGSEQMAVGSTRYTHVRQQLGSCRAVQGGPILSALAPSRSLRLEGARRCGHLHKVAAIECASQVRQNCAQCLIVRATFAKAANRPAITLRCKIHVAMDPYYAGKFPARGMLIDLIQVTKPQYGEERKMLT
eukprot:3406413-Pleurochrysis_carterae.AAC.1